MREKEVTKEVMKESNVVIISLHRMLSFTSNCHFFIRVELSFNKSEHQTRLADCSFTWGGKGGREEEQGLREQEREEMEGLCEQPSTIPTRTQISLALGHGQC